MALLVAAEAVLVEAAAMVAEAVRDSATHNHFHHLDKVLDSDALCPGQGFGSGWQARPDLCLDLAGILCRTACGKNRCSSPFLSL
jgi:hypothetical protein